MPTIRAILLLVSLLTAPVVAQSSDASVVIVPEATVTTIIEVSVPSYTSQADRDFTEYVDELFPPCARAVIAGAYNETRELCDERRTLAGVRRCVCNHPRFIARTLYGCEVTCGRGPRWRVWWLLQRECRRTGRPLAALRAYVDFELMEFDENDPETFGNATSSDLPEGPSTVTSGTITITQVRSTTAVVALQGEQTSNLPAISETGVPTGTIPLATETETEGSTGSASASGSSAAITHGDNIFRICGVAAYAIAISIAAFVAAL